MTVRLPDEKKEKILKLCLDTIKCSHVTIREFSRLTDKLVATEPLERIKDKQLKLNNGNFDATCIMTISRSCQSHIQWWIDNLEASFKLISHGKPSREVYTDSSKIGWGCVRQVPRLVGDAYDKTQDIRTGGHWSAEEHEDHINVLELRTRVQARGRLRRNTRPDRVNFALEGSGGEKNSPNICGFCKKSLLVLPVILKTK